LKSDELKIISFLDKLLEMKEVFEPLGISRMIGLLMSTL